jgi:hypothetical protein
MKACSKETLKEPISESFAWWILRDLFYVYNIKCLRKSKLLLSIFDLFHIYDEQRLFIAV